MRKADIIKLILQNRYQQWPLNTSGQAFAPTNIALCKYWGKRDVELNLPLTSSLSITLASLGTQTEISIADHDSIWLDGQPIAATSQFYKRLIAYIDLFRPQGLRFAIYTHSSIPIAAGFASSASGFAATIMALDNLFGWHLCVKDLSILARLGSGSACRSFWSGFVEWQAGQREDGMDSHGLFLEGNWPELAIGIMKVDTQEKHIGSTAAMQQTVATSHLFKSWPVQVDKDLKVMKRAIIEHNFELLASTAEANALAMHATMISTIPAVIYWAPETLALIHKIHHLRHQGLQIYFTEDAGPNLKLLYQRQDAETVYNLLHPDEVIYPFTQEV